MNSVNVQVARWPLLAIEENNRHVRTRKPTGWLRAQATIGARGLVHITFPGQMGIYDFRLSTGRCTQDSMRDWVLEEDELKALRALRDEMKEAAK